jgi:amino acid adenylation domain-containing protein/non-ribosomal peptide synthase protein (TIGR01720 family)
MIIEKFEEQVKKSCQKIAVKTESRELSYDELNRQANRAAAEIRKRDCRLSGSKRGQNIALLFEHSADMIVGVIAALKADKVYVPLDVKYPENRLVYMLENSQAYLILTNNRNYFLAEKLRGTVTGELGIVNLDALDDSLPGENLEREPSPDKLAYILYTSGSTGRPKGVVQNHGNVWYYVRNWISRFSITESDRMTLFSAFSHDGAGQDMFGALLTGATLYPYNLHEQSIAAELSQWLIQEEMTIWHSVPTLYRYFVNSLTETEVFPHLRFILLGGEPLREHDLRMFKKFFPHSMLANVYGQTESSVSSIWLVFPQDSFERIMLGESLDETDIYIVREDGEIVEDLGVGEIFVSSKYLALGYWHDEETGQRVFYKDPELGFLYRTGDLGRVMMDHHIEFMGRKDSQVKIRGFRVEPGEIESVLLSHQDVKEAAVVVRETENGEPFFCAYFVPKREVGEAELREHLSRELPEYMVPNYYVRLDKMPLTPTNKLDRRGLPEPQMGRDEGRSLPPEDEVEVALVEIWSRILRLERAEISTTSNFFELGGHSLLGNIMLSRIHKELNARLTLQEIFETPTIKGLAALIRQARVERYASLEAMEVKEYYELSSSQKRLFVLQQFDLENIGYNMLQAFRLEGPVDRSRLDDTFRELIQRHESLRTGFRLLDGRPVQRVYREIDFSMEHLSTQEGNEEQTVRAFMRPFNLGKPPLFRVGLVKSEEQKYILIMDMHHIISDGTSMGILARDFRRLYGQGDVPRLRIQYKDYTDWLSHEKQREELKKQEVYWLGEFSGDIPILNLPLDHPRPAVQSFEGGMISCKLDEERVNRLKGLALAEGVTIYMVLLAAFNVLLSKLSGQEDIIIGSPLVGRRHADLNPIIGMFVNVLALWNRPTADKRFNEFLKEVKEKTLKAFENQEYPFEDLLDRVSVNRDASRNPLFDVVFAFETAGKPSADSQSSWFGDLTLKPYFIESRLAKFDLVLLCVEMKDNLFFNIEYCTKLFAKETISRFSQYFETVIANVLDLQNRRLAEIDILPADERELLLHHFNDTATAYPGQRTIHELFEERVESIPHHAALVFEACQLTYSKLDEKCSQLARFLVTRGIGANEFVAVIIQRSPEMVIAVLGILKSGAAYVPLEPGFPDVRIKGILKNVGVRCLVGSSSLYGRIAKIQWELPELEHVLLLDVETPKPPVEAIDRAAVISLWDHVAERATDRVTAGGFVSAYTGEPFAEAEVDEYVEHVARLAQPYIGPDKQVLEIGCGSGLIMFRLAPSVARYVGLDPSALTQQQNRQYAADHNCTGIDILEGFAHQVDSIESIHNLSFDLIILASTVQFFPGFGYLERVIELCLDLLNPGGTLLIADIMDLRQKEDFKRSIADYQRRYAADRRVKPDLESELYVPREFFQDLGAECDQVGDIEIWSRHQGFENELKFRYDVTLHKREAGQAGVQPSPPPKRRKSVWTGWHLHGLAADHVKTPATADDAAYIIFTSGSTGIPKGVLVRHKPVINLFDWVNRSFGVGRDDRLLFVTSLCFDLSVYDIFGILIAGGVVRVASDVDRHDPRRLGDILRREPITFWDSAPALLQQLVPYLSAGDSGPVNTGLRLVFLSGDWIPVTLPDILKSPFPNVRVIGLGGATEATVWSNYFPIDRVDSSWVSIPYGKPIQNAAYFILDANLTPCAIGVAGDLYIGGECLCTGYVNEPELTARSLLPDPFGKDGKRSIYRTGDNARWLPDGNMEFLGRKDSQVKIRGFRIELGEIEYQLLQNQHIKDVVVLVKEGEGGEKYLVGYVVAAKELSATELTAFLADRLPDYMVPSHFVQIKEIPLSSSGKVDRKALLAIKDRLGSGREYEPPSSKLEQRIAEIFSEVLGIEQIGINDNFFEIGGDSIKALNVTSRLREEQFQIEVRDIFLNPTVRRLSRCVKKIEQEIDQSVVEGNVDLTPIQAWFFEQDRGGRHFNQSIMIYNEQGFDGDIIGRVFEKLLEHHDALRMVFKWAGDRVRQRNRGIESPLFDLETVVLTDTDNDRLSERIEGAANKIQESIDLAKGPLVKLALFKTLGGDHLLIVIHHLVIDGVSWRILLEDFASGYRQARESQEIQFPAKSHSFKTWSEGLREYAAGKGVLRELDYWQNIVKQEITSLPKGDVVAKEAEKMKNRRSLHLELAPSATRQLLTEVHRAYNTEINDILLTALAMAIKEWTGLDRIRLILEGHGREDILDGLDVSRTIGWFTSQFPVILDMEDSRDLGHQIKCVKETMRQIPNRGVGYGILRYLTSKERNTALDSAGEPEIRFNYLGQFAQPDHSGLVKMSSMPMGKSVSPDYEKDFTFDIVAAVNNDSLRVTFEYNRCQYDRSDIETLANYYQSGLTGIIEHCLQKEETEITPADIEYSDMEIDELKELESDLLEIE